MPAYSFNPSTFHWGFGKGRGGSFRPQGRLHHVGGEHNPTEWSSKKVLSARLVVGFNVGEQPTYEMADLMRIVERVRRSQSGNPSATFVAQEGIYQHADNGPVVHEKGAQVLLINTGGDSRKKFTKQMVKLAETIAREMRQELVIVEIQKNGLSEEIMGVGP